VDSPTHCAASSPAGTRVRSCAAARDVLCFVVVWTPSVTGTAAGVVFFDGVPGRDAPSADGGVSSSTAEGVRSASSPWWGSAAATAADVALLGVV
jgi:hypothetical protein